MKFSLKKLFNEIVTGFAIAGGMPLEDARRASKGLPSDPKTPYYPTYPCRFM